MEGKSRTQGPADVARVPSNEALVSAAECGTSLITAVVGEPFPLELCDSLSSYWDGISLLVLVVPNSDAELLEGLASGQLQLGVYSDGPFRSVVLRVRHQGQVLADWRISLPWTDGEPPDLPLCQDERMLWQLVVCTTNTDYEADDPVSYRHLPVAALRVFTTSPVVTRAMRRMAAEQRAAGPVTREQVVSALSEMRQRFGAQDQWDRCVAYSWAGE